MSHNTNADLFIAAQTLWFADDFQRVIRQLDDSLHTSLPRNSIEWRTDDITDFRGQHVPASAERLVRWDDRHPDVIFRDGFAPRRTVHSGDPLRGDYTNLDTYVRNNIESVFVGTARYYRHENRNTRWRPRNLANRFEYEVYAFGGIDVNLSLGYNHRFFNQREIAFPGGIRREFIRTAREYDRNGRVVRIWVNGDFNVTANGPRHSSDPWQLPDPVCGSKIPAVYWKAGPRQNPHIPTSSRSDVMRELGDPAVDDLMDSHFPRLPVNFVGGNDAPETDNREYAINMLGTTNVLTCVNGTELTISGWEGLSTQRFRCVINYGYMGFFCVGAGSTGRYLGYNRSSRLRCSATSQSWWEHIFPRADPAGGFVFWMFDGNSLAPVHFEGGVQFVMTSYQISSTTRFCFTRLGNILSLPPRDCWSVCSVGTDSPEDGHTYAIKIFGTSKAFTCVRSFDMQLSEWMGYGTQRFRCTIASGDMGFFCVGANGSKGGFLGYNRAGTLVCQASRQNKWEHFHVRADPTGGFKMWMYWYKSFAPVTQTTSDELKVTGMQTSMVRVSFQKLE